MNQVFNALTPKQNVNVRLKVSQRPQKTYFTAQERQLVHVFRITHPSSKRSTATFRSRSVVHIRQGSHERRKTGAFTNETQEYSNILTFSCFALVRHVPRELAFWENRIPFHATNIETHGLTAGFSWCNHDWKLVWEHKWSFAVSFTTIVANINEINGAKLFSNNLLMTSPFRASNIVKTIKQTWK